ncbi:hypothetical protein K0U00_26570 [Paenibacillus sepulcri]|uniref:Uncharacterized protein n=2 Tax=Paenibacillus sepulcri TaxID=359917 RepID=A0ABS7C9T2_9BACL|nr:hypothetical protein [Paenibacillus sepulcri]
MPSLLFCRSSKVKPYYSGSLVIFTCRFPVQAGFSRLQHAFAAILPIQQGKTLLQRLSCYFHLSNPCSGSAHNACKVLMTFPARNLQKTSSYTFQETENTIIWNHIMFLPSNSIEIYKTKAGCPKLLAGSLLPL